MPDLTPADTKPLAYSVLTDAQKKRFEETLELDFSFGIRGMARFRCNVFNQRGAVGAVYRPDSREDPHLRRARACRRCSRSWPSGRAAWCSSPGPTGSGKSTTLAAMIDKINTERHEHILTIEDPIEYIHQHKSCLVNQREVHSDTAQLHQRAARRAARRPRRRAHRRDARPRDDRVGAAHRRDGPPDVRHAAHQLGGVRRSTASSTCSRRTSSRRSARSCRWCSRASSARRCCRGPTARAASCRSRSWCRRRHPEPDSRGQGAPDLLGDADRARRSSACRR